MCDWLIRLFDMAIEDHFGLGDGRFRFTASVNSFNGEPQAQAKHGNDACGLPLNDSNDSPRGRWGQKHNSRTKQAGSIKWMSSS